MQDFLKLIRLRLGISDFLLYICLMFKSIPIIPSIADMSIFFNLLNLLSMDSNDFAHMETMRKAGRCATLYELLCEALGLEPMSPNTTWRDVAKVYSLTMEEAYKLSSDNPTKDETAKD